MLVSGHAKLEAFLPEVARYVSSVPGLCCVGPEPVKTNIAYKVVARDGRSLYDFNFEPHSKDVVNKVMTSNMAEPTYFNADLLKAFRKTFSTQSHAGVKVSDTHTQTDRETERQRDRERERDTETETERVLKDRV